MDELPPLLNVRQLSIFLIPMLGFLAPLRLLDGGSYMCVLYMSLYIYLDNIRFNLLMIWLSLEFS